MEDNAEISHDNVTDSLLEKNIKFDPSDYLPRRTSRASAHAASEAIKMSVKDEKADPSKGKANGGSGKEQKKEPSRAGKTKSSVKKAKHRRRSGKPYDCCIKLVRCDQDHKVKTRMHSSEDGCEEHDSTYKVVRSPVAVSENDRVFKSQANGNVQQKKKDSPCGSQTVHSGAEQRKSKYLSGGPGMSRQRQTGVKPSSLNVVVVHPKPGSKIINTAKGRQSKSVRLQELISDPSMVISTEVSRIMTTGGNAELQCSRCSKTYMVARDLINHKRMAHKVSEYMCTTCADEFPSALQLNNHKCKAKYRCEICGCCCKSPSAMLKHKNMAHPKTLGSYMCSVCCFNAGSQQELNAHVCGGRPKIKYSARASSAVMVYPTWEDQPQASSSSAPRPNIYVDIPGPVVPGSEAVGSKGDAGSRSSPMQFLCEVCLNMFPTAAALASHKCDADVVVDMDADPGPQPSVSATPRVPPQLPSNASPMVPLGMEVMPEVEQLAKFYSSVVFME
ncbi:uncharacterized protein LOC143296929 [Babylonia areolata]|uniref:uncharacterized protein LOC143296929 n=1 Tax=Babylonia areolata TaxID=304850 RepID=UPI003FCF0E2D